jgi:hypothetical protein
MLGRPARRRRAPSFLEEAELRAGARENVLRKAGARLTMYA